MFIQYKNFEIVISNIYPFINGNNIKNGESVITKLYHHIQ